MFVQQIKFEPADPVALHELQKARDEINEAKRLIEAEIARVGITPWDRRTSWLELSRPLAQHLRGKWAIPRNASNAFFKGIELFNLVGPFLQEVAKRGDIKLFDNASLPGDFIRSMQWWAARKTRASVDWRANSLLGGLDDRFGLMREHPERWMMLSVPDMNGDVTSEENCKKIVHGLGEWRADLYTSDLGFAVSSHYHEEEEHFRAHRAQCRLAMEVLRPGGAMIVKTFTMSTAATMALISELMCSFREFYVVKPATSKPDNSECYWVGLAFQAAATGGETITPRAVVRAQQLLAGRQAQKIKRNVELFQQNAELDFTPQIKRWCEQHIGADTPPGRICETGQPAQ